MSLLNFDSVQCERTRGQLDAYLSSELLVETTGEVLKHLEKCADCSVELESRTRIRGALRKAAASINTPEKLQYAVHQRLRNAHPAAVWGFPRTSWALVMAAMAFVLIATALQQWRSIEHRKQLVAGVLDLGVSDHLQCAIKGHNYADVAPSREKLREKLGAQYAGLLPVVEEKLPGFQVLEAHLCTVNGSPRKYIHFIARGRGTILSVILTRREGSSFPTGYFLKAGTSEGFDLFQARLEGMNAAGFESKEYFGFVVSDLGQGEVLQIAAAIAPPLSTILEGGMTAARVENSPAFHRS